MMTDWIVFLKYVYVYLVILRRAKGLFPVLRDSQVRVGIRPGARKQFSFNYLLSSKHDRSQLFGIIVSAWSGSKKN